MVFDENKVSYYELENKCYGVNDITISDISLDVIIDSSFIRQTYTYIPSTSDRKYYSECEELAFRNNKDFFLLTDASSSDDVNVRYSCLVPKTDKICDLSNLENLFEPFNDLLRTLLDINNSPDIDNKFSTHSSSEIATSLKNHIDDISTCFTISNNNIDNIDNTDTLAKKRHFILYKTKLIDPSNNTDIKSGLENVTPVEEYIKTYDSIYIVNNDLNRFKNSFREYLCQGTTSTQFNQMETVYNNLNNKISNLDNSVNQIARDISYISLTTNYDTLYLKQLVENINTEKNKLNNLLGFDGANNGKLHDTNFMKNIKISEICILFIIMIFIIFIYSKKK